MFLHQTWNYYCYRVKSAICFSYQQYKGVKIAQLEKTKSGNFQSKNCGFASHYWQGFYLSTGIYQASHSK